MGNYKAYIDNNRENMIKDLEGFIEIPSVSSDSENVGKALDYILSLAKSMGFEARSLLDHKIGIIEAGEGEETLGILAHVDVVPEGELGNWATPPFKMIEKDGKLFGRGTLDDKGPIIASLYAMKYILDSGKPLKKKVQMILGTQEEVEWTDMEEYITKFSLPDFGFTPDGEFPLCNIEKGQVDLTMCFKLEADNSEGYKEDGLYLTALNAGSAKNAVPGKTVATLTRYEGGKAIHTETVETAGKAVHSCQPEKGENSTFAMAKAIRKRSLKDNKLTELLYMIEEKFESIYGKEIGMYSESEYHNGEFVHRNVFSPTLTRTEDSIFKVNINVRFAYGTTKEEVVDRLTKLAKEYGGTVSEIEAMPAVYISKERPFMKAFANAYEEATGRKNEFTLAYGGSYAKAMPGIVSWGPIFPEEEDTCHEENEYINISSLLDNGKIFAATLEKIVFNDEPYK